MRRKNTVNAEEFAKLLEECQTFGLKKKDIAEAIGKSQNTVTSYFLDNVVPSQETQDVLRQYLDSMKSTYRFQHIESSLFRDLLIVLNELFGSQVETAKYLGLSQSYLSKLLFKKELSTIEQNKILEIIFSNTEQINRDDSSENNEFEKFEIILDRIKTHTSKEWNNRLSAENRLQMPLIDYLDSIHNEAFLTLPTFIQEMVFDHIYAFMPLFFDYLDDDCDYYTSYNFKPGSLIEYYRGLTDQKKSVVLYKLEALVKDRLVINHVFSDEDIENQMIADIYHMERLTYSDTRLAEFYADHKDFYIYLFSLFSLNDIDDMTSFIPEFNERKNKAESIIHMHMTYDEQILAEERLMYSEVWQPDMARWVIERLSFRADEWHLLLVFELCHRYCKDKTREIIDYKKCTEIENSHIF